MTRRLACALCALLPLAACGAGLASGVYRLDLGHLESTIKARVGAMPSSVREKMTKANLRLSVSGDTARLLSNATKGEGATFKIRKRRSDFLLAPAQGPSVTCKPVAQRSLDCTMPHGMLMRFTRAR